VSNRIIPDDNSDFVATLKQLSEAIEPRGVAPELKDFVQGMKVLAEKLSLEFVGGKPTATSRITSEKNLREYRKGIGESFVMDYNTLLKDRKDYLDMLKPIIGAKNPLLKEMEETSDFLYRECSKPIIPNRNER
jgi:hypothetical protein